MPTITLTSPTALTVITAGLHATNYAAIQSLVNGNLDNSNIAEGAAIDPSKIAGGVGGPAGTAYMWFFATAPTNFALLDGATLVNAQTIYPALWGNVDSAWKSGANIILPNLKGRVPVGRDTGDADWDTMGETRGAKTVTLTTGEIPSHSHPIQVKSTGGGATTGVQNSPDIASLQYSQYNTDAAGGGGAHNNIQPSIVVNWIIKLT